MPRLPLTRLLLIALALGLLTTLALAWVIPALLRGVLPFRLIRGMSIQSEPPLRVRLCRTLLRDLVQLEPSTRPRSDSIALWHPDDAELPPPSWSFIPPSWNGLDRMDSEATGFPLRAFVSHAGYSLTPTRGSLTRTSLSGGIVLSESSERFHIIPMRPIWPGLLGDTIIWSATWLLTILLFHFARARHRRALGNCPTCGCNLAGTPPNHPCPECGQTTKPI